MTTEELDLDLDEIRHLGRTLGATAGQALAAARAFNEGFTEALHDHACTCQTQTQEEPETEVIELDPDHPLAKRLKPFIELGNALRAATTPKRPDTEQAAHDSEPAVAEDADPGMADTNRCAYCSSPIQLGLGGWVHVDGQPRDHNATPANLTAPTPA